MRRRSLVLRGRSRLARIRREQGNQDIRRAPLARKILWGLLVVWVSAMVLTGGMIAAGVWIPGRPD